MADLRVTVSTRIVLVMTRHSRRCVMTSPGPPCASQPSGSGRLVREDGECCDGRIELDYVSVAGAASGTGRTTEGHYSWRSGLHCRLERGSARGPRHRYRCDP